MINKKSTQELKTQQVKWWDKDCKKVIKQRKQALKKFKEQEDQHSFIEYKKAKANARKVISKKKRENFDEFCTSINLDLQV